MASSGWLTRLRNIFGLGYFFANLIAFAAFLVLNIEAARRYHQFSTGWLVLVVPMIGMLCGHWLRKGQLRWWRWLVVFASLVASVAILYIGGIVGPQLDVLKQVKFQHGSQRRESEEKFLAAVADGRVEEVQKLLQHGVSVQAIGPGGQTALHLAQDCRVIELLLDHGARIEARDASGMTPLFGKEIDQARLLIAAGADIDAQSSDGNTPFIWYCYSGYLPGLKLLISHGADYKHCNQDRHNALDIARTFQPHSAAVHYLESLNIPECR